MSSEERRWHRLEGNVKLSRNDQWLEADRALYDQTNGNVTTEGNINFGKLDFSLTGARGELNIDQDTGSIDDADYWLPSRHMRGHSQQVHMDSKDLVRLRNATFTSCPTGHEDWYLRTPHLKFDRASGFGSATNVTLTFMHVPVFYLPYISFPLTDERTSGFLYPTIGYSDKLGAELATPYYLNLAPNYDATLTPRILGHRGVLLDTEFRFLTPKTNGKVELGYLPDDAVFGADRKSAVVVHQAQPIPHVNTLVNLNYVSDERYLSDFDNNVSAVTDSFLERRYAASYADGGTNGSIMALHYQPISARVAPSGYPYGQLPRMNARQRFITGNKHVEADIAGEFTRFDHKVLTAGQRLDLAPHVRLPYLYPEGFFIPELTMRYTQYQLEASPSISDTELSRSVPIASLDTGLFFERNFSLNDRAILQTLEPRLYYAEIPYRDQNNLPLFDAGETTFSFSQLFYANRFSGIDRVGDTRQLSTAITTRFIEEESALERFSLSVGEIFYFEERRVQISNSQSGTTPRSNIAAQSALRLTRALKARADMLWNPESDLVEKGAFRLQYRNSKNTIFNASYRFNRASQLRQTDYAFIWPLSTQWRAIGRWQKSRSTHHTLDALGGLEYSTCCWNLRFLDRRVFQPELNQADQRFMIELELKGFTNIGKSVTTVMTETIPGFAHSARPTTQMNQMDQVNQTDRTTRMNQ